ncbi:hypothetical protein ACFFK0_12605 [Paenibacillus chartarius]|uniref:Holin n=1 Tax=Paenibacillus chartarius TaxID=747481 RepID=A0ABV6DKV1_9BACL
MDIVFKTIFPLLLFLFVVTDWPGLGKTSTPLKITYGLIILLAATFYMFRFTGYEPPTPIRFFIEHVAPAVEAMLGLK